VSDVGLVEPLDPEMAVEVGRGFAKAADGVVLQCVLGLEFTKFLTQIRKIFLNSKVLLQSSYS